MNIGAWGGIVMLASLPFLVLLGERVFFGRWVLHVRYVIPPFFISTVEVRGVDSYVYISGMERLTHLVLSSGQSVKSCAGLCAYPVT